jgi:uncharacterized membrane protein
MSTTASAAIFTSVGTGMLSLTGIVFSLLFVMVRFSAIAYSPRLALCIARDRVIWHALGVFVATFIYEMAVIAWLDRNRSGTVLFFSGSLVITLTTCWHLPEITDEGASKKCTPRSKRRLPGLNPKSFRASQ